MRSQQRAVVAGDAIGRVMRCQRTGNIAATRGRFHARSSDYNLKLYKFYILIKTGVVIPPVAPGPCHPAMSTRKSRAGTFAP